METQFGPTEYERRSVQHCMDFLAPPVRNLSAGTLTVMRLFQGPSKKPARGPNGLQVLFFAFDAVQAARERVKLR